MSDATASNARQTIATYLSDMLALQQHIQTPVKSQLTAAENGPLQAATLIGKIGTTMDTHVAELKTALEAAGGSPAHGIKTAWASLIGIGAAVVGGVRDTKVAKILRDDYTALSLAVISYEMLHATATGLGDTATATLAKRHLDDLTAIIVNITALMPEVVLAELAAAGEPVTVSAGRVTQEASKEAWSGKPFSKS